MTNWGVNLGLSAAIAQPKTGCIFWYVRGDYSSVPCIQNTVVSGLVTVNLNCIGETLWGVEASVGLRSFSVAVLTLGGMCCVYHSMMCVRAVS